jgi:hypothetical protein
MQAYIQSVGGETAQIFHKFYATDFNTAWQAALDALKHSRLDITNKDSGYIQTRWTENTAEKNFTDSFGAAEAFLKAQYRFRVSVSQGYYNGKQVIKVSVHKEQLVQHDVLEGWRPIHTDSTDENTLLYRIGQLIHIKMRIDKLEQEKAKKQLEK